MKPFEPFSENEVEKCACTQNRTDKTRFTVRCFHVLRQGHIIRRAVFP